MKIIDVFTSIIAAAYYILSLNRSRTYSHIPNRYELHQSSFTLLGVFLTFVCSLPEPESSPAPRRTAHGISLWTKFQQFDSKHSVCELAPKHSKKHQTYPLRRSVVNGVGNTPRPQVIQPCEGVINFYTNLRKAMFYTVTMARNQLTTRRICMLSWNCAENLSVQHIYGSPLNRFRTHAHTHSRFLGITYVK